MVSYLYRFEREGNNNNGEIRVWKINHKKGGVNKYQEDNRLPVLEFNNDVHITITSHQEFNGDSPISKDKVKCRCSS